MIKQMDSSEGAWLLSWYDSSQQCYKSIGLYKTEEEAYIALKEYEDNRGGLCKVEFVEYKD